MLICLKTAERAQKTLSRRRTTMVGAAERGAWPRSTLFAKIKGLFVLILG